MMYQSYILYGVCMCYYLIYFQFEKLDASTLIRILGFASADDCQEGGYFPILDLEFQRGDMGENERKLADVCPSWQELICQNRRLLRKYQLRSRLLGK